MAVRFGISCEGRDPPDVMRTAVATADAAGAETLWLACHLFLREPIALAALALASSRRVKIALMAMSPYSVHPVYATMAAATLDEVFPGRVQLCFGVGAPRDLEAAGIEAPQPIKTLRETLQIARDLLAGETVNFQGERFRVQGRGLPTGPRAVPIMLAASGPQMLELAGAAADGVLISAATAPAFIRWTLEHVRRGEAKAGRKVRKSALVYTAVHQDETKAHDQLRRQLGFVLRGPHHARNLELAGSTLDQIALTDAFTRNDSALIDRLIGDDIVRRHAASGTPDQLRSALADYHAAGLDEIVLAGISGSRSLGDILDVARAVQS